MPLIVFDTETTGTPRSRSAPLEDLSNWPRIVQIAWVVIDDAGRELQHRCDVIRPEGFAIPADAARIHGITTDRAMREGVPLRPTLEAFCRAVKGTDTVVAHNFEFDSKVTGAELIRMALENPFAGRGQYCTMKNGASVTRIPGRFGDFKWPTLAELHAHLFETPHEQAHNALADVRACARCYLQIAKRRVQEPPRSSTLHSDDDEELISEVEELASEQDWFDAAFVESVREQFDARGRITERQRDALVRIRDMLYART